MYVYTDGRLIWSRDSDLLESTDAYNTGLVEQRLTPGGRRADAIRSHIEPADRPRPRLRRHGRGGADPDTFPFVGFITVRDADRLVGREFASAGYQTGGPHNEGETTCRPAWGCAHIATAEEERRLQSLYARLTDPASWRASAWADQEIRAYVPSRYRVCYGGTTETIVRDRLLHAIPGPVQELLEGQGTRRTDAFNMYVSFGDWVQGVRQENYCSELTTEEARDVVQGLDDGGFEREYALATFEYILSVPDPAGTAALWIDPYLPHGDTICIPCT
jgi:hypothetical protein